MIPINRTYAPLQAFVDELARCGLHHAVTCPGSRNAPLLFTLAADERIRALSVLDERSAAFVALGIAKSTARPVAVTCTSGTAAANFLPALEEAREAGVPLLVLTADRPPELRGTGAGQSIDQIKLYGSAVKWFVEVGNHEPDRQAATYHRSLACRAYWAAASGRPGPVHLNFPLREPLAPVRDELDPEPWQGRPEQETESSVGGRPWVGFHQAPRDPGAALVEELAERIKRARRGVIVCGPTSDQVAEAVAKLAASTNWPLLAEPTSGVRCGHHDRTRVVAHYDALLRQRTFAAAHVPDLVVRIGDAPTSRPLRDWLAGARQLVLDPGASWHDPTRTAELVVAADVNATCAALAEALGGGPPVHDPAWRPVPDSEWLDSWRGADATVQPALAAAADPFEPKLYAALAESLPEDSIVWLSSSMPVRDVETFFPQGETALRFLANRGANGIDGVVSSAVGAAAVTDKRCYLLIGELALLHDLGGLLAAHRHGVALTIICINNGGGGIFEFLPLAEHAERAPFEEHVVTPSGIDLARVAALVDLPHSIVETPAELRAAARGPGLIEARTDRARNVRAHQEVFARIGAAIEQASGSGPALAESKAIRRS